MMNTKRLISMRNVAIFGIMLLLSSPATAIATSFSFLPGGDFGGTGNKGTGISPDPLISKTKDGLTLSLTALTGLTNAGDNITGFRPVGKEVPGTGTIVIDTPGMGVQDTRPGGSKGISGGGPLGDEVIKLSFSVPVLISSIILTFTEFDFDETPVIYLDPPTFIGGNNFKGIISMGGDITLANLGGGVATVDFSQFGLPGTVTELYVGEIEKHYYLGAIDAAGAVPTPEPSTLLLLGSGLAGLAFFRRKRKSRV